MARKSQPLTKSQDEPSLPPDQAVQLLRVQRDKAKKLLDNRPITSAAKQTILHPDKPIPKQFSAVLSRWIVDEESLYVTKGLMDPFPEKPNGVNVYRFYFGEVVAHIKADSRPFPKSLRRFALLEQPNVMLLTREASNSKDWAAMINTAKEAHKNYDEMQKIHQKKNI